MNSAATAIDLSPVFTAVIGLCAIALTTLGSWAVARLAQRLNIDKNSRAAQAFDDALGKSIHAGAMALDGMIRAKGYDHPEVKSEIIKWAAPYAIARFAPALKSFGLDPNKPIATSQYLTRELDRVFPLAITPIANSPATPPIPPDQVPVSAEADAAATKALNKSELDRITQGLSPI